MMFTNKISLIAIGIFLASSQLVLGLAMPQSLDGFPSACESTCTPLLTAVNECSGDDTACICNAYDDGGSSCLSCLESHNADSYYTDTISGLPDACAELASEGILSSTGSGSAATKTSASAVTIQTNRVSTARNGDDGDGNESTSRSSATAAAVIPAQTTGAAIAMKPAMGLLATLALFVVGTF